MKSRILQLLGLLILFVLGVALFNSCSTSDGPAGQPESYVPPSP